MRRETSTPKVPEDPNAPEEKDTVMNENDGGEQDTGEVEDQSSENDDSSDDDPPVKANGKATNKVSVAASTSNPAPAHIKKKYQNILETRMTEIKVVFDNGIPENVHHSKNKRNK